MKYTEIEFVSASGKKNTINRKIEKKYFIYAHNKLYTCLLNRVKTKVYKFYINEKTYESYNGCNLSTDWYSKSMQEPFKIIMKHNIPNMYFDIFPDYIYIEFGDLWYHKDIPEDKKIPNNILDIPLPPEISNIVQSYSFTYDEYMVYKIFKHFKIWK